MARKQKKTPADLNEKVERIMTAAELAGLEQNVLFVTTFARYRNLMALVEELRQDVATRGAVLERTFSSGQKADDVNPSVDKLIQASNMANLTANTLMEIITKLDGKGFERLKFDDGDDL